MNHQLEESGVAEQSPSAGNREKLIAGVLRMWEAKKAESSPERAMEQVVGESVAESLKKSTILSIDLKSIEKENEAIKDDVTHQLLDGLDGELEAAKAELAFSLDAILPRQKKVTPSTESLSPEDHKMLNELTGMGLAQYRFRSNQIANSLYDELNKVGEEGSRGLDAIKEERRINALLKEMESLHNERIKNWREVVRTDEEMTLVEKALAMDPKKDSKEIDAVTGVFLERFGEGVDQEEDGRIGLLHDVVYIHGDSAIKPEHKQGYALNRCAKHLNWFLDVLKGMGPAMSETVASIEMISGELTKTKRFPEKYEVVCELGWELSLLRRRVGALPEEEGHKLTEWIDEIEVDLTEYHSFDEQMKTKREYMLSEGAKVIAESLGPEGEESIAIKLSKDGKEIDLAQYGAAGTRFQSTAKDERGFSRANNNVVHIPFGSEKVKEDLPKYLFIILHEMGHTFQEGITSEEFKERVGLLSPSMDTQVHIAEKERDAWNRAAIIADELMEQGFDVYGPIGGPESAMKEIRESLGTYEISLRQRFGEKAGGLFIEGEIPKASYEMSGREAAV